MNNRVDAATLASTNVAGDPLVDPPANSLILPLFPPTPPRPNAALPQHPQYNPCKGCPRHDGSTVVKLGPLTLDTVVCRVLWYGRQVALTVNEYRVVARIALNHGQPVTYRLLYDELKGIKDFIAGPDGSGNSNMRSAIKRIRRKFGAVDPGWNHIKNHNGYGYAWSTLNLPQPYIYTGKRRKKK